MPKPQSPCIGFANWRNSWQFTWSFRAEARNLSTEALITHFFRRDIRSIGEVPHCVRDGTLDLGVRSIRRCETLNCRDELVRIVRTQRKFSTITQRDRHRV
jgi:hypothetical protein